MIPRESRNLVDKLHRGGVLHRRGHVAMALRAVAVGEVHERSVAAAMLAMTGGTGRRPLLVAVMHGPGVAALAALRAGCAVPGQRRAPRIIVDRAKGYVTRGAIGVPGGVHARHRASGKAELATVAAEQAGPKPQHRHPQSKPAQPPLHLLDRVGPLEVIERNPERPLLAGFSKGHRL